MYTSQLSQIEQLQNLVGILRERIHNTAEKKKVAEANATTLSHRCAAVLSAARDLVPTITEAEHEYFMQLKRYEASCTKWQAGIDAMPVHWEVAAAAAAVGFAHRHVTLEWC